jgi:hypothetical protein
MIDYMYIYCFFFSLIVIYLINKDLKNIKFKLYKEIDINFWIKLYSLITIALIHVIWLFFTLFLDYNDKTTIYGFPFILIIAYIIYIISEFKKNDNETYASQRLNKCINIITCLYIILLIIFILIPLKIKYNYVTMIRKLIHKFIF